MKKMTIRTLAVAALAAASLNTFAANDGTVGSSSSSGDFDITLTVATQIVATNFDDMPLDTASATLGNPIEGFEDICVGGIGFANYSVNLASTNGVSGGGSGSNDFQLNGSSQDLPYTASFIDNTSSTSGTAADSAGDVAGSFARTSNVACASDNARVIVSIDSADWETATEASYSDTLTVTVTAL